MTSVRMPDGQVVKFPDTMSDDEIRNIILNNKNKVDKETSIESDTANPEPVKEPVGFLEASKNNLLSMQKGYYNSTASHLWHPLANIAGMLLTDKEKNDLIDDIKDNENTGDTTFKRTTKNFYRYAKNAEQNAIKKAEKIESKIPNNFWTNFYAGVGATPQMIATYGGVQGVVKSSALAVASVDALLKADEGIKESLTAGAKGAVLGKYLDLANSLAPVSRTISLGAMGYGTSEGDLEQRLANGLTFGAMGLVGPMRGQKTFIERETAKAVEKVQQSRFIKQFENPVDSMNKNLSASIDVYNALGDKKSALQKDLSKQEKILKRKGIKPEDKIKTELKISEIKTEIRSTSASQGKLKKQLDTLDDFLTHQETFINRVNREATDYRTPTEAKLDAVKLEYETKTVKNKKTGENIEVKVPKLRKSYADLKESLFNRAIRKQILPREFLNEYPVFKRYVDEYNLYRISVEDMVLKVLDNAKIVSTKGLTALRKGKLQPSEGGMLYRFNRLSTKEKEDLVVKTFEIERRYDVWSSKKKEERGAEFDKDGTVTDGYLGQLGLNTNQIVAYRDVMNGFEIVRKYYNSMAQQYGSSRISKLTRRPNFFPHIFTGEYRVYVSRNGELISAEPVNNPASAKLLESKLKKKFPNADINTRLVQKNKGSDDAVASFSNVIQHLEKSKAKDSVIREVKNEFDELFATSGFNIHKLSRKKFSEVSGFLGTQAGKKGVDDFNLAIKLYVEGAIKTANGFRLRKNIEQFAQTRVRPDSHHTLQTLYPNSTKAGKEYVENALGMNATKISAVVEGIERSVAPWFKGLYTTTSALANHFYLLQLNARFAMAQGLQPYQMIPPKLAHLSQLAGKDNVTALTDAYLTVALIQKQLITPDKFSQKLIETAVRNRTINDNFLREFAGEGYYKQGKFADVKDVSTKLKSLLSGRALASNLEQFSRLNATLMFGHHLKRMGVSEKAAINQAWRMADKYMVRYDLAERPFIYQQLGSVGRAAGLFKTFMHNYHAQMIEAIQNAKRGDSAQLLGMVASSAVVSGLTGAIFVKSADQLVGVYNNLTDSAVPNLSMFLLQAGLPDWMIFGIPSNVTNLDLTATLAAPDINPLDIISFPGYDFGMDIVNGVATISNHMINDVLISGGKPLGVLAPDFEVPGLVDLGIKETTEPFIGIPPATSEVRDAWKKLTPNSLHGLIELWYQKNSRNPFYTSKQNARTQRKLSDWRARFLSSYSLKEAMLAKIVWQQSVSDRSAAVSFDKITDLIAENMFKFDSGFIPEWLFEKVIELGYTPDQAINSSKRKFKNMTTDSIQKILKGGIKNKREYEKLETFRKNLEKYE